LKLFFCCDPLQTLDRKFILPTIISHSVIAVSAAYGYSSKKESLKFLILSVVCSILPDADVIGYQYFYVPYLDFFGHRGFFHSPFFAALLSVLVVYIFFPKNKHSSKQRWKYVLYFFLLTTSHGLLDAMTNGGNGIALLSPITNKRYFFPWTPIEVSPLGIKAFLSQRGFAVLISELLWLWIPSLFILIFLKAKRNR
jgi:inner membrane protein